MQAGFAFSADRLYGRNLQRKGIALARGVSAQLPGGHRAVLISGLVENVGAMLFKKALLGFLFWEDPQQGVAALP